MRTLRFIVDGQSIKQDPSCDFSGLVPGSEGYLQVAFSFTNEWKGAAKVASFWSMMGYEYPPQALTPEGTCMIPAEALKHKAFKVQVIGKTDISKLTTNRVTVTQDGGKV